MVGMSKAQTVSTESPVKRLITPQGVLTVLGLVTGTAVIFFPVGILFVGYRGWAIGVLATVVDLANAALDGPVFDREDLVRALQAAPLLLAIPISAGYLRWLLAGGLAPWAWRTGYALAVLAGLSVLSWIGWSVLPDLNRFPTEEAVILGVAAFCALAALGLGVWLVMRNRRVGLSHALNALIALQVVYVAYAPALLVLFRPRGSGMIAIGWGIGAWFALLTVVVYVAQIVLGSLRKGGTEP